MNVDTLHIILSALSFVVGWWLRHRQDPPALTQLRDHLQQQTAREELRSILAKLADAPPGFEKR